MPPSVSLLVAAYNEEASLERTLERALNTLEECSPKGELIVLDDASRDRTPEIIKNFVAAHPKSAIRPLRHDVNKGIATTFEDLYRAASKDWIFLISGDGEYPPEALRQCIPLMDHYDIIVCRRVTKHYTFYRRCISNGYRWCVKLLFSIDLFDPGTIKVVKSEIFTTIPVRTTSVFVESERLIKAIHHGYRIGHIDINQEKRMGGKGRGARFSTVWATVCDMISVWVELVLLRKSV